MSVVKIYSKNINLKDMNNSVNKKCDCKLGKQIKILKQVS